MKFTSGGGQYTQFTITLNPVAGGNAPSTPDRSEGLPARLNARLRPMFAPVDYDFDWLVIGSGFGGSVSALRLAQKGY